MTTERITMILWQETIFRVLCAISGDRQSHWSYSLIHWFTPTS